VRAKKKMFLLGKLVQFARKESGERESEIERKMRERKRKRERERE
jgi:hypothetical protein